MPDAEGEVTVHYHEGDSGIVFIRKLRIAYGFRIKWITVNFNDADDICTIVVDALIKTRKLLADVGGRLLIKGLSAHAQEMLKVTGADQLLVIETNTKLNY